MAKPKTDPIIRFSSKYVVDEETGCWNFTGRLDKKGYGRFRKDKMVFAHRFSYEYYVGPLDDNLVICHECNNTKCCNPEHLRQDTRSSNSYDMLKSGRNPRQKLSIEEVKQIKKELKHYYRGQCTDLAHFYKVDPMLISQIKRGIVWKHTEIE